VGAERDAETDLKGGWVTSGIVRVGETVRRPPGPNSPFVHKLLDHLEEAGFDASPRLLGPDEKGREILTYVEGDSPSNCRSIVWSDEQLAAAAELLRRFHDATARSVLAAHADVVCHNDFGPWNLVWRDELPVAIIDYDYAAPGTRLDDLGYAVWKHLNLGLVELPPGEQSRRLRLMSSEYGVPADLELLGAIDQAQERMRRLITAAPTCVERDEALSQHQHERDWMGANRSLLLG